MDNSLIAKNRYQWKHGRAYRRGVSTPRHPTQAPPDPDAGDAGAPDVRTRIVAAAAALLASEGRDAVTTRAVAAAAGVQAPALYRLFGDKGGLLEAVAEHGFAAYLADKEVRAPGPDPVADLRTGWDLHVEFGLKNPALYALMYGDPGAGVTSKAAAAAWRILRQHVRRVAVAGRLRVSEARAADLIHAAGCGTVLSLLAVPEGRRDAGLSQDAREAVIAAITTEAPVIEHGGRAGRTGPAAAAAVALRAVLPEDATLTRGERQLLGEWLDRLAGERAT